jgi:hypothetical protein
MCRKIYIDWFININYLYNIIFMNSFIYNILLINFIGTLFYIAYIIYEKKRHTEYTTLIEYKKNEKKRITIYIIGIIFGLIIIILSEKETKNTNIPSYNSKTVIDVSDVSDIFVK